MTNENGRPRWSYELESKVQALRSDHESMYREFKQLRESAGRQMDRIEGELRSVLPIPQQVEHLTQALDRLSARLEDVITQGGQGRRSDWTLAIMVISLVAMVIFSIVKAGAH